MDTATAWRVCRKGLPPPAGNSLPPGGGEAAICAASSGAEGARLGFAIGASLPESWQRGGWCLLGLEANKFFHLGPQLNPLEPIARLG